MIIIKKIKMVIIITLCLLAFSVKSYAGGEVTNVTFTNTPDCCVKMTVHINCFIDDGEFLHIDIYPDIGSVEQYSYSLDNYFAGGADFEITICPENGATMFWYQVYDSWNNIFPGTHQFSTNCCKCPSKGSSWLNLTVSNNETVCPGGCLVKQSLNIPDSITCYHYYKYKNSVSNTLTEAKGINESLTPYDFCIAKGKKAIVTIYLLKNSDESIDNACVLTDTCHSCSDSSTTPTPCTPDCDTVPWSEVKQLHYTSSRCPGISPGCNITVYYTSRTACGGAQDFQILRIQKGGLCYSSCTDEIAYQDALGALILYDPMIFDPLPGNTGTSTMWRVVSGSCWADWTKYILDTNNNIIDSLIVTEPCYQSICCVQPITVTRYSDGSVKTTIPNSNYEDSLDCTNAYTWNPYTDDSLFCHPVCQWIPRINNFNWFNGSVGNGGLTNPGTVVISFPQQGNQKAITNEMKNNYEEDNSNYYSINTYQSNNNLNVTVNTTLDKELTIKIYDLNGNIVKSSNYNLNKGINSFTVEMDKFITGVYIYSISIDGLYLKSNKISIIH